MEYVSAFSGFSVKDTAAAKQFYGESLGLQINDTPMGLELKLPGTATVFVYQKDDHQPAVYTILNLVVKDVDAAIEELVTRGIEFLRYDSLPAPQDAKGVLRGKAAGMGPDIAWFADPSGNIISLLEE